MNQDHQTPNWRQKLTDQEAPMDIHRFWDQLEPRLPRQRRRRLLWLWLLPVGLLLAGGVYWWNSSGKKKGSDLAIQPLSSIQEPVAKPYGESMPEASVTGNHPKLKTSEDNLAGRHADQEKNTSASTTSQVDQTDMAGHPRVRKRDTRKQNTDVLSENRQPPLERLTDLSEPGLLSANQANKTQTEPEVASDDSGTGKLHLSDLSVGLLSLRSINLLATDQPALPENARGPQVKLPANPRWTWAVTAGGGPGIGIRSIRATDQGNSNWISEREKTEKLLESWQVRVMGEVVSPAGFYLEAGLQWTRQNERFDWSTDSLSWTWGPAAGFLIDDQGGKQPWQDTTWSSYNLHRQVRHYNQISTIDLPIGIGYERRMGDWSFRVGGGLMINLNQTSSGRSLHPAGWPGYWENEPVFALKQNIGMGYYGQLRISRVLFADLDLYLQPGWSAYPGHRQMDDRFTLRYDHIHLLAGIRWRLSKQ